jgi:hypothetical protein
MGVINIDKETKEHLDSVSGDSLHRYVEKLVYHSYKNGISDGYSNASREYNAKKRKRR